MRMQFEEYNGWPNFPTWCLYTTMTSSYWTYQALEQAANSTQESHAGRAVAQFVKRVVATWELLDKSAIHEEAVRILVQDFLTNAVRRINWTQVHDTLRGERESLGKTNDLTSFAYGILQSVDWQALVASTEYLTEADSMLQDWLLDQCTTWVESPNVRRDQSQITLFAKKVLEIYYSVIDWGKIASALRDHE